MIHNVSLGTITQQLIDDYATVSTDNNPIHLDKVYAIENGLPSTIAHGMLIMGLMVKALEEKIAPPYTITTYDVRFKAMVLTNDRLRVELEQMIDPQIYAIHTYNQHGEMVITGEVTLDFS
ncbi:MaoC family dehydratase [Kurthia sibirica]|uniref:MaoC-like domain-containing protein n=1 Tax=Kurthia sibirica TaxID=202750 RepID=A0A2U3ALQ2_9BACL|nr:MaoC family dehydratase [Kurthia sibirica]PWI25437.1 hypothetical protein DEX24_08860 [Kurthia sibirica]GEK34327.1 hypothetical protein KSI01_18600 [Kurthia sibirica]